MSTQQQVNQAPVTGTTRDSGKSGCLDNWPQRLWDVVTIIGTSILAAVWLWYSGMAETNPDWKSSLTIVLLPLMLIIFRRWIDRLLRPLQPLRNLIPKLVRIGIGLAMPFLVANYLYSAGSSQFEYMFRTIVISTITSFIILRNPTADKAGRFLGTLRR